MSGREWKPGDVGVSWTDERFIVTREGRCAWATVLGNVVSGEPAPRDRPLVVIDPEDREQVARLAHAYWLTDNDLPTRQGIDNMQKVLREFANPKPPKPEEPTGMGAVVEDAEGVLYVGLGDHYGTGKLRWKGGRGMVFTSYDHIDAVRVLSEGVQP